MRSSISAQFKIGLARGVAVVVLCGAAVGCSRGMDGLTDGLTTSSTNSYSNERVIRPQVPVGGGYGTVETAPQYSQLPPPAPAAPVAAAPVSPVYSSPISSSPLPPPQNPGGAVATAPQPAAPQQVAAATSNVTPPPVSAPAAPAPADRPAAQAGGTYTVEPGETLYGIARKTGASAAAIQSANNLSSPDSIRVGQRLVIPGGNTQAAKVAANPAPTPAAAPAKQEKPVTVAAPVEAPKPAQVQKPATVATYTPPATASSPSSGQATSSAQSASSSGETQQMAAISPEETGGGKLRWPVQGRVISQFGKSSGGKSNDGIDIAVPEGTSIRAAEAGTVIYAGDGLKGFGNTVLIRHEDGLVTVYGHASQLKVKRGDTVKRGQEIALSGMTGDADRPKLHFEVRRGTSPVNPMTYLN